LTRAASNFRQTDVTRALRATAAAGIAVRRIEIDRDGKIVIVTTQQTSNENSDADPTIITL
jgi:hypothetical protein